MKRDIGKEILQGLKDIKAHKRGKKKLATHLKIPPRYREDPLY